jgi:hypothetical protein
MTIERITAQNNELHRQSEIKKLDQRHNEIMQEERRIKHQREVNEQERIEMNRRMNRPGQNVDRMA